MIDGGPPVAAAPAVCRMDPRSKIIAVASLSILAFKVEPPFLALISLIVAAFAGAGRVGTRVVYRACKPALPFILIVFLLHLLFTPGPPLLSISLGPLNISTDGLIRGSLLSWRLTILLLIGCLLTITTAPTDLTRGIEKLLRPIGVTRLSPHDVALMLSLALRFIPTISKEAAILRDAQSARCASLDSGGPLRRLLALSCLTVPLCLAVFRRCDDLITAMEARGYDGGPRTGLVQLSLAPVDLLVISAALLASFAAFLF